jgi:hypothetical protein
MKEKKIFWSDYINEEDYFEESDKKDYYKENYFIRDNFTSKYISPTLSKPITREKLIRFVGDFIDKNYKELSTSGPVHMILFSKNETSFLYELFNISENMIAELIQQVVDETYAGKLPKPIRGLVDSCPHKLLLTIILSEAIQKDYKDIIECCEYLIAFSEYPLLYRKYWELGVREDIMNYTIEHLVNKFKAKKVKNIRGLLKLDLEVCVKFHYNILQSGMDHTFFDFIYRVRGQINNTFKNIAREYYKNDKENATQYSKSGVLDDGSIVDQEGYMSNVSSAVNNTYNKIIVNGVNNRLAKIAAEGNQVDGNNVVTYINQIMLAKNNKLYRFIENIITAYMMKNPTNTSVGSGEFLNYGLSLYKSIRSLKSPIYQEICSILDMWMYEIVNITNYFTRDATIINYTAAIFRYMILIIKYHN